MRVSDQASHVGFFKTIFPTPWPEGKDKAKCHWAQSCPSMPVGGGQGGRGVQCLSQRHSQGCRSRALITPGGTAVTPLPSPAQGKPEAVTPRLARRGQPREQRLRRRGTGTPPRGPAWLQPWAQAPRNGVQSIARQTHPPPDRSAPGGDAKSKLGATQETNGKGKNGLF